MGSSGSAPEELVADVRRLFAGQETAAAPITAAEAADRLECPPDAAERSLGALVERGELESRQLPDGSRVWWQPGGGADAGEPGDREEFTAFVDAVEDYAIFRLDPEGVVASWNEGAARIKGYDEEDIIGTHFSAFYTDEDDEAGVPGENLEKAERAGRVEDEGWRVRADGTRFWANVTITAVHDDDGDLKGFTKVTRDMTERREYEQQVRLERDLTEQIIETVPVSIGLVSDDGDLVRANRRMLDRLGIDEGAISTFNLDAWTLYDADGEPVPADEWPWSRVAETGDPVYDFQCQVDLPDLGRRWLSVNAAPISPDDPDETRIVVSADDITEQKDREQRLRREYNQTRKLLRTAPIAVAVQDADGETVMANDRAQEALGVSEQEILDDQIDDEEWRVYDANGEPLPPDETPSTQVLATGEPVLGEEITIDPPDGDEIQFRINAAPVFDADGDIERVITAAEDITELKRRERQLEQRKTELETEVSEILDRVSDAFYALDDQWTFTHVNEQAAEIMDRSVDELLGRDLWEVFPDLRDSIYAEQFRRAMETQEPVDFEVYGEDLDAWLEFNVYPSESGLSIYFRDVTERVEHTQELAKYETIVETMKDGIYVKDEDGYFTMVNDAYAGMVGYDRDELVGAHASLVVDEDAMTRSRELEADVADGTSEAPAMEATLQTKAGDELPAEGTFASFETSEGEEKHVGVVRDITERKERERALERANERLTESNERLEQFAYAASHDLQEPLRMVSSYLQLIERRYADALDADGREFLEYAVDGADRMRDMIEGLLAYSRVERRGDPFEPVDLDDVLADVREDLGVRIEETDADVTVGSLPTVEGDAGQLRQVFQNLLDNAIEYSGDEPPVVEVSGERRGDEWVVAVADEGVGIDPAHGDTVFEMFQSLHGRDEHPGIGLGLALSQRIVERHGGDIRVESEPGEGATFSIALPASPDADA